VVDQGHVVLRVPRDMIDRHPIPGLCPDRLKGVSERVEVPVRPCGL
jgi:hypothetical protein